MLRFRGGSVSSAFGYLSHCRRVAGSRATAWESKARESAALLPIDANGPIIESLGLPFKLMIVIST